jgi:hypothetical protein
MGVILILSSIEFKFIKTIKFMALQIFPLFIRHCDVNDDCFHGLRILLIINVKHIVFPNRFFKALKLVKFIKTCEN